MTTIDQVLEATNRYASAGRGILFVARTAIAYQPGCGPSRPVHSHSFLVLHPKDANNSGTWVLPESVSEVVPPDVFLDEATTSNLAGVPVASCVEFEPALGEKYDAAEWLHADFIVGHPWSHPNTAHAVESFERAQMAASERRDAKGRELGRGVYFDHQTSGAISMTDSRKDFLSAQEKADPVFRARGDEAPPAMQGESVLGYRQRLAGHFQQHSKQFANTDLSKIGCPNAFGAIEDQIFSSALQALQDGSDVPPGKLRAVVRNDAAGRPITKYLASDAGACWDQFNPPIRHVTRIMVPGRVN